MEENQEQKDLDTKVHLRHCYQGEYEDSCKYGEENCPAKKDTEKVDVEKLAKDILDKHTKIGLTEKGKKQFINAMIEFHHALQSQVGGYSLEDMEKVAIGLAKFALNESVNPTGKKSRDEFNELVKSLTPQPKGEKND